jgi:two-component system phosphate regulon sensor histidine kinase PhoR
MVETHGVVDSVRLLDALTEVVDTVTAGSGGLGALQRLVELSVDAAGATGGLFVELGPSVGRVVAAAGTTGWALGRPIDMTNPTVVRMLDGDRVRAFGSEELGQDDSGGTGGWTGLRAVSRVDGDAVGVLALRYPPDVTPSVADHAALALLAAAVAHLYTLRRGLPVYADVRASADPGEAFATLDTDGVVRSWNAAATRLTARERVDAIGEPWPFPLPKSDEVVEHQMACGRWIEIRSTPPTSSSGTEAGRSVSFRPRPEPSQRDEDQDLFVALTSHELRTPVTVIRGYADTLVEHWHSLDERARREAVYIMGQRARDLSRLVDRLLMAAGTGAGPLDARTAVPFDLVDALRDAAGELTSDQRRYLRSDLPPSLPKALGDRTSMVTVLAELVTNACKYSVDRVDVELTAGSDGQSLWFRVADRGVGVRPEHVERVFERFWQMESGDQRRYGGVGLGLYLVRRIVERQNGWVSLRPRAGGGTIAEVRLPRADESHTRG